MKINTNNNIPALLALTTMTEVMARALAETNAMPGSKNDSPVTVKLISGRIATSAVNKLLQKS